MSYLLSTNGKLHAPHDAKCKVRHKSYPGSYKLPKTDRKKKRHTKAKGKVKDEGHGRETWSRVDDRALPLVTKGCEVQEFKLGEMSDSFLSAFLFTDCHWNLKRVLKFSSLAAVVL